MSLDNLSLVSFIGLTATCIGLWAFRFIISSKQRPLLSVRTRNAFPLGLVDVVIMFTAWIFSQIVAFAILSRGFGIDVSDLKKLSQVDQAGLMFCLGACQLIFTIACLFLYRFRYGTSTSFGWQQRFVFQDIKTGLLGFLFIVPIVLLVQVIVSQFVKYEHGTLELLDESDSILPMLATWFGAVLVAPIVEEVFFRGVLQGWLQRIGNTDPTQFNQLIFGGWFDNRNNDRVSDEVQPKFEEEIRLDDDNPYLAPNETTGHDIPASESLVNSGQEIPQVQFDSKLRWLPIFASTLLFAASHSGQGAAPIPLFFFAVGLGYLFRQTGSVVPCIVVHMLLNLYTMFWATLRMVA